MNDKVIELRPGFKGRPEANKNFSYVETSFTPEYEKVVRTLTRAADPEKEKTMGVQDRLIYAFITVNPTTGVASEFAWASGRKDTHIMVDLPYDAVTSEVLEDRAAVINKLMEKYHDRGFQHGSSGDADCYDGGAEKFAQNFERATGRKCAHEVVALFGREQLATA
jgi:hypothetical protein